MACPCVRPGAKPHLLAHENPHAPVRADGRKYWGYATRKGKIRGIVVHTAEALDDLGEDTSAEAVAKYFAATDRPCSAHAVSDADSIVELLPDGHTAFHCVGANSETLGLEIGYKAGEWGRRKTHERKLLLVAACWAKDKAALHGIPAERITAEEWHAGGRGFLSHADLDPDRRTDPGSEFPWARFLAFVRAPAGAPPVVVPAAPATDGPPAPAVVLEEEGYWTRVKGALRARGCYAGKLDEVRDDATVRAVCTFQRAAGLKVDGLVGPKTLRALGLA